MVIRIEVRRTSESSPAGGSFASPSHKLGYQLAAFPDLSYQAALNCARGGGFAPAGIRTGHQRMLTPSDAQCLASGIARHGAAQRAISNQLIRAGNQFITSSRRAPHQPKRKYSGVL